MNLLATVGLQLSCLITAVILILLQVTFIDSLNFASNFIVPLLFVYIPLLYKFYHQRKIVDILVPLFVLGMSLLYFIV